MALEFNADKQIIQSEQLKIKNSTSVRIDLGDGIRWSGKVEIVFTERNY